MQRSALSGLLTFAILATAWGCKSSTEPKPSATHPAGIPVSQITALGGRPFAVRATGAGDVLVTEQDLNQAVHADSSGTKINEIVVGHDPGDVVSNRAGTQGFVSNFNDGTISFVNLANNTVSKTVSVSPSNAYRLALSSDESILYVSSTDGNLYTVNTQTQTAGPSKTIGGALQGLALDHAGRTLYVSSTGGTIARLDASSLTIGKSVAISCAAQDIGLATNDAELYVACETSGRVMILDPSTLATKDSIMMAGTAPFGLAVSPDNAQLYVTSPSVGRLTIVNRAARSVVKTLLVMGTPRRVAFSARGDRAYVANEGNWVDIIE